MSNSLFRYVYKLLLRPLVSGDVAQMVERSLSMREVRGSIPCISTPLMMKFRNMTKSSYLFRRSR